MKTRNGRVSLWILVRFLFVAGMAGMMLLPAEGKADALREDCIGFNPDRIAVKQIQARWKLVAGSHWILDFGSEKAEADQSFNVIKNYGFDSICFVGRPDPAMTYFTSRRVTTTVFIVRHAEKRTTPLIPPCLARASAGRKLWQECSSPRESPSSFPQTSLELGKQSTTTPSRYLRRS